MPELKRTHDEIQVEWTADISKLTGIKSKDEHVFAESPEFAFGPSTMRLKLAGSVLDPDAITLGVIIMNKFIYFTKNIPLLQFTYGLKQPDGTVEELGVTVMKTRTSQDESKNNFTKLSEVIWQKLRQRTSNDITITFTCKVEGLQEEIECKKLRKEDVLSQDFKRLFSDMLGSDIILHVKDREFKAHKAVLNARSNVFATKIQQETPEEKIGAIKISDCDPVSFPKFLEFLYCGELEELSPEDALNLYETAEKYKMLELQIFCGDVLSANMTVENFSDVASLGDKYNDSRLQYFSENFFNKYHSDITQTFGWNSLTKGNSTLSDNLLNGLKEFSKANCD